MKRGTKFYSNTKYAMLLSVLFICLLISPKVSRAAEEKNTVEGIIDLKPDTAYYYDLDGDGSNEKLYYESKEIENAETTVTSAELKVYVNDKMCFSKKEDDSYYFELQLCDLDVSDNSLDIYLYAITASDGIRYSSFGRYNNGNFTENETFKSEDIGCRYYLETVKGDGTFSFKGDTLVYSRAIGCYFVNLPYQIKNNVISSIPTSFYTFHEDSKGYTYKAKMNFSVYKKVGSKIVAFNVKKGNEVHFDMLYVTKSGKAYVRAINSSGKKGWIRADLSELFYELPLWS